MNDGPEIDGSLPGQEMEEESSEEEGALLAGPCSECVGQRWGPVPEKRAAAYTGAQSSRLEACGPLGSGAFVQP